MNIPKKKLKVAHVIAEVSPFSKVGGLGDVGYALPKAIARLGHEVIIVTPYYGPVRKLNLEKENIDPHVTVSADGVEYPVSFRRHLSPDGIAIYFIVNEELFGSHNTIYDVIKDEALRWIVFAKAVTILFPLIDFKPNILHIHDWHSALVTNYVRCQEKSNPFYADTAMVFTIHNLSHQGTLTLKASLNKDKDKGTGAPPEQKNYRNYINFMKRGIVNAHAISTVSERYAKEILTPKFGCGLDQTLKKRRDRLFGIINGIDYEVVNPAFDENVYEKYDVNSLDKKMKNKTALQKEMGLTVRESLPLVGMVNRLSEQKGFKLIMEAMKTILTMDLQLVVVGSGNPEFVKFFRGMARRNRNVIFLSSPFTQKVASRVYAGSDIYLMPSRFEPCGLSQLISLRYGSIPIVHSVGGLHDTITDYDPATDTGNGFAIKNYNQEELLVALARATESYKYKENWQRLVARAMKQSFSWELPARKYVELYRIALKLKNKDAIVA